MWFICCRRWGGFMRRNEEKHPAISVLMSVYNGEQFLGSAIESVLNQTFRDFEFIIVNDGSTDGSLAMLEEYAHRDHRICLISRENRGLAASLNEGISHARGAWIARMDADDISLPDRFEKQLTWLQKTGSDICGGSVKLTGIWLHRVWRYYVSSDAIALKLLFGSAFAHPAVMLSTDIAKMNPYSEHAHYVEDYELWARLAASGVKMANYPGVVLRYRIHPGQVTVVRQQEQRENMVLVFKKYAMSFLDEKLAKDPAYLLIADKQRDVHAADFYQAVEFMDKIMLRYGDLEGVVSTTAFTFFARCGELGMMKVIRETRHFKIKPYQKMVLLFLLMMRSSPKSKLYQMLYRLR
ncbi:MAG: glycosyltransferase [Mariprofundaceae bacterium]